MVKMSQKEAVFQAICNVTGHTDGKLVITKEQRAQVNMVLFEAFRAGNIQLDCEYSDTDLKGYVSGLQSNWIRKDKRLNGGVTYKAKNPGSRAGHTDPMLKSLKALFITVPDADKPEIQGYIDARIAELNATKVAATVDFSALPADLASKYGK